jgi:hypothetical protein
MSSNLMNGFERMLESLCEIGNDLGQLDRDTFSLQRLHEILTRKNRTVELLCFGLLIFMMYSALDSTFF